MFEKVFISGDHTSDELKQSVCQFLQEKGIEVFAIERLQDEDYTDIAKKVSRQVLAHKGSFGVIICGSGVGVSIVSNKQNGIRAALCHAPKVAEFARKHNDANVLCLGARFVEKEVQIEIVNAFISNEFEGGRHELRVKKIES